VLAACRAADVLGAWIAVILTRRGLTGLTASLVAKLHPVAGLTVRTIRVIRHRHVRAAKAKDTFILRARVVIITERPAAGLTDTRHTEVLTIARVRISTCRPCRRGVMLTTAGRITPV